MGYQMVDNSLRAVLQLCAYANVPSSPLSARYAAFVDGRTLRRITAAPKGTPDARAASERSAACQACYVGSPHLRGRCFMIIREWRGTAVRSKAEAYPKHFHDNVVPELRLIPGFAGAQLSCLERDDKIEFLVLTRWQSLDAIRAFAGADIAMAVVEPNAVAALVEFDRTVRHYEVLEEIVA
jgi:heme-degrading monooxygenase HmoA